jgi:hypothetical protein
VNFSIFKETTKHFKENNKTFKQKTEYSNMVSSNLIDALNFDANRLIWPASKVTADKTLVLNDATGNVDQPTAQLPADWERNKEAWGQLVRERSHINMGFQVRWSAPAASGAYQEVEDFGEVWTPNFSPTITFVNDYSAWDKRTLNLHPAVAGLSMTAAGFDQAYLQALGAAHHMFGGMQRGELFQTARDHMGRLLNQHVSPFRLLIRGVNMWLSLRHKFKGGSERATPVRVGQTVQPTNVYSPTIFNSFLTTHADRPVDVVFVPIYGGTEVGIVQALDAMCCAENPIPGAPSSLKPLWPTMKSPRVAFTGPWTVDEVGMPFSADDVWNALTRLCDTYDCWDLLKEAFDFVGFFFSRPTGVALWMGRNNLIIDLPESKMAAGAIGPLYNGTSAEAMRTAGFQEPDWKEVIIEGAIRAMTTSAASGCLLSRTLEFHYCNSRVSLPKSSSIKRAHEMVYAREFVRTVAGVCEALGWTNCIGRSLRGIRPTFSRQQSSMVLDPLRYCSLTTLLPWMPTMVADSSAAALMRPAIPNPLVPEHQWMQISTIGTIGAAQIEAAMHLLPMQVRYVLTMTNGQQRIIDMPMTLDKNRSSPMMVPKIKTAHYKINTYAKVDNIRQFLKGVEKCSNRNNSVAHVVLPQLDPISVLYMEDADDPSLGSGHFGGRPLTEEELNEGWPTPQPATRPPVPPPVPIPPEVEGPVGKPAELPADATRHDARGAEAYATDVTWNTYLHELRKYNMIHETLALPRTVVAPAGTSTYDNWSVHHNQFAHRVGTVDPIFELRKVPLAERNRMARVAAAFYRHLGLASSNTATLMDAESTAYAYDGLARATASCPALNAEEFEEWTGHAAPDTFNDIVVRKFLIAGSDLIDAIGASKDDRAAAAERLERRGERITAQRLMQVVEDMRREAKVARDATCEGTVPTETDMSAAPDEPGVEESRGDFGAATSQVSSRQTSPAPVASDVAEETGTSQFMLQFSDPAASKQPEQ